MYWRETYLVKQKVLALDGTTIIDLPKCGNISGIKIQVRATNAANLYATVGERIVDHITRIRVTDDGARVLFSLTGKEIKAGHFYDNGDVAPEMHISVGADLQQTTIFIPFGRFYKDWDYLLSLDAWCNLRLEITNDADIAVFEDESLIVDVIPVEAKDFRGKTAKWIKRYESHTERPAVDGEQVIYELPSSEPIKSIMIQLDPILDENGEPVNDPKVDSTSVIHFAEEREKAITWLIPLDLMRNNAIEYGRPHVRGRTRLSDTLHNDFKLALIESITSCAVIEAEITPTIWSQEDNWGRFQKAHLAITNTLYVQWDAVGYGLYHTMMLWDSLKPQGNDLLDLKCGCNHLSPSHIMVNTEYNDFHFRCVLATVVAQGKV